METKREVFDFLLTIELTEDEAFPHPKVVEVFPPNKIQSSDPLFQEVGAFCFPDSQEFPKMKMKSHTFSFVMTKTTGERLFGFCRRFLKPSSSSSSTSSSIHNKRWPLAFVCISSFVCYSMYHQILEVLENDHKNRVHFLDAVYRQTLPPPGGSLKICDGYGKGSEPLVLNRPTDFDSLLDLADFEILLRLDSRVIVQIFASLLVERRLIFVADELTTLTSVINAMMALIYPFTWEHIYIPVLPPSLLTFCCAPMPFVLGILRPSLSCVLSSPMDTAIFVDITEGKTKKFVPHNAPLENEEPENDIDLIPPMQQELLVKILEESKKKKSLSTLENKYSLSNPFLMYIAKLITSYADFIEGLDFRKNDFLREVPEEHEKMATLLIGSQMFNSFVQKRAEEHSALETRPSVEQFAKLHPLDPFDQILLFNLISKTSHASFDMEKKKKNCILSDWMIKLGGKEKRKNWNRRWFILHKTNIEYLKSASEVKPSGVIDLFEIKNVLLSTQETVSGLNLPPNTIVLQLETSFRTYYLRSEDNTVTLAWFEQVKSLAETYRKSRASSAQISSFDLLHPNLLLPFPVVQCVEYIRNFALDLEGIFRKSGTGDLEIVRESLFNQKDERQLEEIVVDHHVVPWIFRGYLRNSSTSIIPSKLWGNFVEICTREDETLVSEKLIKILKSMHSPRLVVVVYVFQLFFEVLAHSKTNQITSRDLGIDFGPAIIRPQAGLPAGLDAQIVMKLLDNYEEIFPKLGTVRAMVQSNTHVETLSGFIHWATRPRFILSQRMDTIVKLTLRSLLVGTGDEGVENPWVNELVGTQELGMSIKFDENMNWGNFIEKVREMVQKKTPEILTNQVLVGYIVSSTDLCEKRKVKTSDLIATSFKLEGKSIELVFMEDRVRKRKDTIKRRKKKEGGSWVGARKSPIISSIKSPEMRSRNNAFLSTSPPSLYLFSGTTPTPTPSSSLSPPSPQQPFTRCQSPSRSSSPSKKPRGATVSFASGSPPSPLPGPLSSSFSSSFSAPNPKSKITIGSPSFSPLKPKVRSPIISKTFSKKEPPPFQEPPPSHRFSLHLDRILNDRAICKCSLLTQLQTQQMGTTRSFSITIAVPFQITFEELAKEFGKKEKVLNAVGGDCKVFVVSVSSSGAVQKVDQSRTVVDAFKQRKGMDTFELYVSPL